ncbi:MAG: adenylate/guanylate cyclase domain-containing protein [Deltaproteobacteria bacterium]|nr:adenylate/guanylate cyclase domain-containing protein [Deltaproteobacteria bacterium]
MGWLNAAEDWYYDVWHHVAGLQYQPQHVVIAAIDDQTRLEHHDEPLVFWSPHFARAAAVLREAGARAIGFDFLFSVSAESWLKRLKLPENDQSRTYDLPFREQLAAGKTILAAQKVTEARGKTKILLPLPDYWGSLPGQLEDVGLTNFFDDPDGVIRRFLPAIPTDEGESWISFAALLAERAASGDTPRLSPPPSLIGFSGPPGTVPRVPFRRLLSPGAESDPQIQGLKDKVVIIAYEPTGVQDIHQTPYSRGFINFSACFMSGPEVHANIVETLLTGRFPRPVSAPWRLTYLLIVLTVGTAAFFKFTPRQGLAVLGLLAVMLAVSAYLLFRSYWLLPVATPQLGLLASYLGVLGLRLTGEERERTRLRRIFGHYVSDEVVEKLLATGKQPNLGGEAVTVTVLFADIRNFTPMSESLAPQEVVELLNNYFTRTCEPILEQGGMVDKFIGDAVMAVFGSPAPHPDHARRAITAALAMTERASDFRAWIARRFPDRGWQDFHIGIGLHTGEVVVGNIGSPKRFEFTAIGDTVNTASRLESLTKELGWTIVASAATIEAAGPGVVTGGAKKVRIRGRQEPVEVLEVKSPSQDNPSHIP